MSSDKTIIKSLNTLSARLNYILQKQGVKKADLARAIGIKPQSVQYLCDGEVNASKFTLEMASFLGINPTWLANGEGEIAEHNQQSKLTDRFRLVPVLTEQQLILNATSDVMIEEENIHRWEAYKATDSNIFCMVMSDASMEPLFKNHSNVFFDRNAPKQLVDSNIVVAYSKEYNSIFVRYVKQKDEQLYLTPANTKLFNETLLTNDFIILGNVVACHFYLD